MNTKNIFSLLCLSILLQSCGLLGIHFKVHNPKKEGKTPQFSEEAILLGEMTPLRSCYDVHYYDLDLAFDADQKSISGTVEMYAKAQTDFDSLQLDLHSNFEILELSDKNTGSVLSFRREERAVVVQYNQQAGNEFSLRIRYSGKPTKAKKPPWKGGFVWKKDKEKKDWLGVACESEGASVWWPLKDHTADEPDSIRLHFKVPKGLMAVGNGQFEGSTTTDSYETFHWFVSYPINTYNVSVYIGDFIELRDTYKGINGKTLALSYFVLKENEAKAAAHFKQVNRILRVYENKFGEYPWYRDGFKLIESPYAGMEHQTAIAYGNGYKNDLYGIDYIILHEVAHEWWGNSVTASDLNDVWIQEGFATYAEALYFEVAEGNSMYRNHLYFNRLFIKNKYPVVGIKDRRWFHFRKGSDAYMKGAWILNTLRQQLKNDSLFFDIIYSFYQQSAYQLVESKDFIQLVNQKTQKDFNWFFNQYLYNNFAPELEYTIHDGVLYYKWSKVNEDFNQLKVKFRTVLRTKELIPTTEVQTYRLPEDTDSDYASFLSESLYALKKNRKLKKSK